MIERTLGAPLRELAGRMPVVAVTGPRQSGKTTLCPGHLPDRRYVTREPLDVRDFATADPRGFLEQLRGGAAIDEVKSPKLHFIDTGLAMLAHGHTVEAKSGATLPTGTQDAPPLTPLGRSSGDEAGL